MVAKHCQCTEHHRVMVKKVNYVHFTTIFKKSQNYMRFLSVNTLLTFGEGDGTPLQCSCLDGRAWWAAVYGVTQSRTRLMRLKQQQQLLSICFKLLLLFLHGFSLLCPQTFQMVCNSRYFS